MPAKWLFGGPTNEDADWPAVLEVEYFKYYQTENINESNCDPISILERTACEDHHDEQAVNNF